MKTLLALADSYIVSRDWKMLALVKFCLASVGLLLGLEMPARHRKTAAWAGLFVFLATWPPLMADFGRFSLDYLRARKKTE